MANKEYTAMLRSTEKLTDVIAANNPKSIGAALLAAGLLPQNVNSELSLNITDSDRAMKITNALTMKVKAQPSDFQKMITTFENKGLDYLVTYLQEKLSEQCEMSGSGSQGASGCSKTASTILTVNKLNEVYQAVFKARTKWYEIGMGLKVDISTLDAIQEDETKTEKRLLRTLQEWLQNGDDLCWATLKKVLESSIVGRRDIASTLPS